ncbi:MAG: hypothetical protein KGY75_06670 [Candidatus Cloacimonetes bacterium]|nr:hypothetical protein [Candidatus Cloacimonadota bacterium]
MTKKFEQQMENLDVPVLENDPLKNQLKRNLENEFFPRKDIYRQKFRIAVSFCVLFLIVAITFWIEPRLPTKLHQIAFGKKIVEKHKKIEHAPLDKPMLYTSIDNPKFSEKIIPEHYQEDVAYLIRHYSSQNDNAVVVVSKFGNEPKKSNDNIIY